ncbi:uncharacterized protein BP01DRAFT_354591 [Aspergillus saccharolyticus JOP 1030-1]|uniref:Uncharacterized protein n=1 Tax=Aspergillus saccharolyticus JOP 1030-1 TaxID=1450539 RepID=A0A318ZIQ3_9EURO|nr:hypothetical protein BP01DRAFT_354591 [Aspergillus saccharolyticus JOP 1030-1]PYH47399.1 hypothetical protein BP01DRAFT_354591 [Aspergillus saccharolyticus JOP 1030-1]
MPPPPSSQGLLHSRQVTPDWAQFPEGGLRRSNAVKHPDQQHQQQASFAGEERMKFVSREGRANTTPYTAPNVARDPKMVKPRLRATTFAVQATESGSEWSFIPGKIHEAETRGKRLPLAPPAPSPLEQRGKVRKDEHYVRTQQWVMEQQQRSAVAQSSSTLKRKPLPPLPPYTEQQQQQQQQWSQPVVQCSTATTAAATKNSYSSTTRRPFFRSDSEVDKFARSTTHYEDRILTKGERRAGKFVQPVQARKQVRFVTPHSPPESRVASPVDEISDQREVVRRALYRQRFTGR